MLEDLEAMHKTLLGAYMLALRISGVDLTALQQLDLPTKQLDLG